MANYQNILRQAHQAIADVADNADSWRAFLRSAAYTTHYAFPNQALIYSQRPGATMLADIDTWNRAAGRWVNRGAHGVASLGTGNMAGNVRYLFDIKDTHPAGKASKPLGWQITDANRYPTLQALQEKHNAESLPEIFGLQAALFVAEHGKQLDADLQNAVIGSTLEWAKPQEQTAIFANLITQSAVYMAAVRCGLGDSAVPQDAFADIDRFDTESAVLALGNAVNRAGRQMFAEIGAVVKSIDSVAKTQPKQYDENVSKTNQQEVQDHGYDESERVSGAQDGNEGNAQTAGRQNRSAAGEVPAREPLPAVRQDAAGRDAVQRPETDRAALLGAGGADHHEAAGQQPGTGQEQRPVGLDGAHEQSASAGGGIGDAHRDEPVNTEPTTAESEPSPSAVSVSDEIELPESVGRGDLAEETAAAIGLPSLEQQQETIRQLQPRASWQPPIKDGGTHIDEQDIVDVLVMGSGFCEGRFRIQEFFSATVLPTVKEQADWLKKEYGIGGRTWDFRDGERGFLDYDAKGLRIKRYASDNDPDYFRLLPWNEVARRLHLLVHNDQYLDENNKQAYEKWEAEQQAKRDARQAEIDYAEKTIADFCEREGLGEPDFSNLTHIDLAYSTTGDGEHEIQVYANFLRNEIVYLVDGSFVDSARFDNTRALAKEGIEDVEFSQFIDDAESAYEAYQERYKPKPVEKRPLAAGDTVYLENDHPFTVEEIGIFDVHLRDEGFPLIGRAINRAEFARLLAANPKNQALAAPELANVPDAGEAAEVIEGEVLEPVEESAEETSSGFGEQVLQAAELIALKEAYEPNNYIPPQDPAPPRTPREKFAANITAIRTLKSIEKRMADGGPHANGEEQEILAQYSGWGGLSDAFEPNKDSWHSEYTELKSLLTEEEYAAARSSTLTAFYTPPEVIDAMYTALRKMGVGAGTILEPSMGVGAFFGQSHSYLYEPTTRLFGVELDSLTGRIARQLYQKANIQITGFEKADLPDSFFDVVIGNVPFGDYSVVDPQYNRLHFKIHDYFFAKSIDKLRTGGIIAFVTTSGTLDKKSEEVRRYINARCDFIGAVRLPDSTFKSAGTKAMADIIFLQKRDRILEQDAGWLHTTQTADGLSLNSYFSEHPEMVCGTLKTVSGPYGPTLTCEAFANKPLADVLQEAMSHLHAEFHFQDIELQESGAVEASIPAEPDVRNFSFCIRNGKFYYRENAIMREVSLGATSAARMRLLIELRDTTRELIQAQLEDMPDEVITELQAKLNRQYDNYHHKFGLINSRGASLDMRDDSGYFLLCSLENLDSEGNFIGKSDMFTKRTIRAARPAERVETASEALALSVGERAGIDFGYMQQLVGKDKDTLVNDLQGVIFADPLEKNSDGEPRYYTADEYLSGDVRHKLQVAKLAAQNNPAFAVNVQALETVQPKDLEASEIAVRLGATWLAPELIKQFADELVDAPYYVRDRVKVLYIPLTGVWNVTNKSFTGGNIKATVTYGTQRANFYHILEESLNLRDVRIFDTKEDMQGNKIRVLNAAATQEAQMKQQQIEDAFKDWIWKDATRRQMLVKEYNERFNSLRPREYDGSHILFHGMSPEITLRPHQKNAIAHILYGGNTLLAHVVGAGKTYEMVAAAMEKKRLGLCSKTLICVPNHLTEQMAAEALLLYPNAEILVARKTDFEKANRKKFCARIATGNFDIIVIGHSQFERIPLSQERQVEYLQSQIHDVINQVAQLKEERAENFTVKQMERMRKQLEKKLDKLNDQSRKDDVVTFEQLGVDSLMVDEAHAFKNLAVLSKMRNVAGISQTESQRASDLYMKCRYLDEITGSRGVVFATGTPISNSMAELYTMQRYLQRETLEQHGLSSFDAWASTFGETVTAVELAPEGTGYRTKTRFSKFYNLPELMSMFKQVADVQTADMLNLPVPKLVGGKPINVALPPSPQQKQMVADLADRAEEIRAGNVDPTEDNMLKVTNDGRKLALDQRLIDPNLPENPNDKVHACAENVYRIWSETKDKKLTQLVFCDLSTPKPDGFNVYDDLRNLLITMGIPENEVQFIHSANTEVKKAELFAKVRSGDVRVLMGSTGKMGAGTNVQRLLVATHHLDCGWKPSDIEQRNGRMIRQGNTNAEVYEYRYVTEASFDSYMWQLLETKQKFIGQVMTSKSPARSADDLDDAALSYAEVKALAAGNPMIKEKMDLDIQVARLKTLKIAYNNEHYRLEDAITQGFPAEMRKTAQQLENAKADTALLQQNAKRDADGKDIFTITLMDTVYTKREDAGKALLGLLGMAMNRTEPVSIGRYKGFDLQIAYFAMDKMYLAYLVGSGINPAQLGADAVGNTMRLDNCLHNLPQSVTDLESKLVQLQKQMENAKEQLAQPFAQADELAEKSKRLAELEALLNLNEKDIVLDTVPDEDQPCRLDNRQRGQER
ncbi:DEAD/DEAH box helicase family protein [Gemmiger formicilis]|nr:DEAD/DEAH box helicase family protein [Gemmiger formicilis]